MFKKSLIVLVLLNFVAIVMFVFFYGKHHSLVPLYIGLLPLVLCNYIYAREFIAPKPVAETKSPSDQTAKKTKSWGLLIMPLMFCLYLPKMIRFDSSLGWSPVVNLGFSILLCIVLISLYGGAKTALKSKK